MGDNDSGKDQFANILFKDIFEADANARNEPVHHYHIDVEGT